MGINYEAECRAFAEQFPTDNVLRAISLVEDDHVFTWQDIHPLFMKALAQGLAEVKS